jgi:hypothetical protein
MEGETVRPPLSSTDRLWVGRYCRAEFTSAMGSEAGWEAHSAFPGRFGTSSKPFPLSPSRFLAFCCYHAQTSTLNILISYHQLFVSFIRPN